MTQEDFSSNQIDKGFEQLLVIRELSRSTIFVQRNELQNVEHKLDLFIVSKLMLPKRQALVRPAVLKCVFQGAVVC